MLAGLDRPRRGSCPDLASAPVWSYARAVPDYADDPTTELERKARALSVIALTESVTYVILFTFWLIVPNTAGRAITGSVHGMIWLAFCAMVIMITPEMKWSWKYTIAVIVLGPIGGIMVWDRIRREGVPPPEASKSVVADSESQPNF